jgi:hypothetical protein
VTVSSRLLHLEWQALLILYSHREREYSPMRLVGYKAAISGLMRHDPPLARWVGKASEERVHITDAGIARYHEGYFSL